MSTVNRYEKSIFESPSDVGVIGVIGAVNPRRRDRRRCGRSWMALPFLLCGMASTVGHAGPAGSETTEIRLHYDRRDLASPTAARRLLKRIGDAALEACGASPFSLAEFKIAARSSRCWRDAVDDAVRRIGSPTLSALTGDAGTNERSVR